MKNNEKNKKAISPATYAILGVALIALVFLMLPSSQGEPSQTLNQQPSNSLVQPKTIDPKVEIMTQKVLGEGETEEEGSIYTDSTVRNPFLPPLIVRSLNQKTPTQPVRDVPPVVINKPTIIDTDVIKVVEPIKQVENRKPIWKGFLQVSDDRLAIIQYDKRSYFLRRGDRLTGTEYRLIEMNSQNVVLLSPTETLKLEREKKGAK